MRFIIELLFCGASVCLFVLASLVAIAQHSPEHTQGHDLYHAQYQGWVNKPGFNCCNDKDCSPLADDHLQEGVELKVRVDSKDGSHEWCPVLVEHLLRTGKSPDWSRAHACILEDFPDRAPCDRLKCFADKLRS